MLCRVLKLLLLLALLPLGGGAAADDDAVWALLARGGQVVLIRHAVTTPGVGDPPGMRLDDCASQRNLSEEGRREALSLGEAWRQRRIPVADVLSSPWCRCVETARLAFRRDPRVEPALGNLFGRPELRDAQVARLAPLAGRTPEGGNLVMLTHGSTILALTGVSPGPGEMVVLTPAGGAGFKLAGRLVLARR